MKNNPFRFIGVLLIAFALLIPSVKAQAASSTGVVTAGQSVTFKATADGTAPFTYAWTFTPVNSAVAKALVPLPADPSTFVIPVAQLTDAGTYSCVVSNSAGKATGVATLTALPSGPTTVSIAITIK